MSKTVASSHQFLGGSWTFFKLAAAPIGIFAALHSSSLCNSLLCPGCHEIRWCFGNLRIPMVVPLLGPFLQVFLPAAVAGNSLAVAAASAFHVAMRFATSFGSLGQNTSSAW